MGSLAASLTAPPARPSMCGLAKWLDTLDDVDRKAAENVLADRQWTAQAIFDAFCSEGFRLQYSTVQRHRVGNCSCP